MYGIEKLFEFCIKHDIEIRIIPGLPYINRVIVLRFEDHKRGLIFAHENNPEMLNALISSEAALDTLLKEVEFRLGLSGGEE